MNWERYNIEKIKGKYLYKFISEKHLNDFIKTGNIWFSRSDIFEDKMECVSINDLKKDKPDFSQIEERKKKHLIACFHEATFESLALWDKYAETTEKRRVFALKFNREYLVSIIENVKSLRDLPLNISELIHGKVRYKNLKGTNKKELENKKVKYLSLRKEWAFVYEREYRFVIKLKKKSIAKGFGLNLGNPKELKFSILLNPLLKNKEYVMYHNKIKAIKYQDKFKLTKLTKWLKPDLW
jgi:hypothetical protein